ncbi:MAG: tryptophan synthase subunit alpha [Beggiatoa sp. IS2]|nr:MAG: tryptophan synthase subunit alpha [Beggiatoa sp. IS2]
MTRLTDCFKQLRTRHRCALIPFLTAGDPDLNWTVPLMHTLVTAGADLIELGVPFSDPMADGPVIQRANERALRSGTRLQDVLDLVKTFRTQNQTTPVILMGYLNPIEIMGYGLFAQTAKTAGVDGVITVDMPPEEATELVKLLRAQLLAPIFLLAPTSTTQRIERICSCTDGYLYYVSLKGVTGSAHLNFAEIAKKVTEIRKHTDLPIGVGFGIRDAETAAKIAQFSDAVIVGSALVQRIETTPQEKLLEVSGAFLQELRTAIDTR